MTRKPLQINIDEYPSELHSYLDGAKCYDSSCSPEARVMFIDKRNGYFLKIRRIAEIAREHEMTRYFHRKGLAAKVVAYHSDIEHDYFLTEKIRGDDCTTAKYLEQPKRLAELLGERLAILHSLGYADCPVPNHTERYLAGVEQSMRTEYYDKSHFPDSFGYESAEQAWAVVRNRGHVLKTDTLLHGDYCLPNIILDDWQFNGFIDLDNGGVGDRHIDLFWGAWTLHFNLKTTEYRDRFFDAYGRGKIDEDVLRIVAACEVFG